MKHGIAIIDYFSLRKQEAPEHCRESQSYRGASSRFLGNLDFQDSPGQKCQQAHNSRKPSAGVARWLWWSLVPRPCVRKALGDRWIHQSALLTQSRRRALQRGRCKTKSGGVHRWHLSCVATASLGLLVGSVVAGRRQAGRRQQLAAPEPRSHFPSFCTFVGRLILREAKIHPIML